MANPINIKTVDVQPGDTLWKLAERELGNGKYYLGLYLLNAVELATSGHKITSDKIGPDFLWPGQKIKVIDSVDFDPSGFHPSGN